MLGVSAFDTAVDEHTVLAIRALEQKAVSLIGLECSQLQ